jgi:hypothetical protein
MASDSSKTIYKPGEVVPKAGIYRVSHAIHRAAHKASLKAGGNFPPCRECGTQVRFELLLAAEDEKETGVGEMP